jgi:hypothetical protein
VGRRKWIRGVTDLATLYPELAAQWHPTKNGDLRPEDVLPGTEKLIWWQCDRGHDWQYTGFKRIQRPGCPVCSGRRVVASVNDLATTNPELAAQWHSTKNGDLTPQQVGVGSGAKIWWTCSHKHDWQATVSSRTAGNGCPVCAGQKVLAGYNDMATTNPELAAQWHPTKNGDLTPQQVVAGSNKRIWWLCDSGHEWQVPASGRNKGNGCPICAGQKMLAGYNDLATTNPELAAHWHPTKNGDLTPQDVVGGSQTKVWWKCDKGHEWRAPLGARKSGRGCPVCSGNQVLAGYNDMATTNPELAAQWHPTKNGDLTPSQVMAGTGKAIWWLCDKGHEWQISGRGSSGAGCPYCSGRFAQMGESDLATTNPELAAQWHPTKNGDLKPTDVKAYTNRKVWWLCDKGHEWHSVVATRAAGNGCPVCSGNQVLAGYNDMATTNPELAAQWHPTKNGDLTPSQVVAGSGRSIWWKCDNGHEWATSGASALKGLGCPFCGGNRAWAGFNDLATTNPELAAQWHPTKNGDLTPSQVMAGSSQRAWWECGLGHDWVSIISHRSKGSGCPVCAGKQVQAGFNDLATTNPELAAQWHPTKNGDLTPQDVVGGSQTKVWWKCDKGHEWSAVISSRSAGKGCSACAKYGFDPSKAALLYFISNRGLNARKIGITNVGTTRLAAFAKAGWQQILTVEDSDGELVRTVETALFKWLRLDHALPQHLGADDMKGTAGATETFSEEGPSDFEIMERIRAEFAKRGTPRR